MTEKFNPYAINPNDYMDPEPAPKVAEPPPKEAEPLPPRSFGSKVAQGAAILGGGAAGAAFKYDKGMFGPDPTQKFQTSTRGMGIDPLPQFQLGTRQGQVTEGARQELQMLLAKTQGAHSLHGQEAQVLRDALERAIQNLPEASMERGIALQRLAELGGVKAPRLAPLSTTAVSGVPDSVTQTLSAQTSAEAPVSPLAKAMGQHEFEHYMKLARAAGAQTLDDLARLGITDMSYAQKMLDAGLHLPTAGGQVFVRPNQLMGADNLPLPTTQDRAAAEAATEQARVQSEAARRAEVQRAVDAQNARYGYNSAEKRTTSLQDTINKLEEQYLSHVGKSSPAAVKLAPEVEIAQQRLLGAQANMPNALGYAKHGVVKSLPIFGGALSGAGALDMGYEGLHRSRTGDPIGAALSGAGSALSAASMRPQLAIPAGLGALGVEGLLMLYDKFGPPILNQLEKSKLIPKDWNPANFSYMPGMK